MSSFSRERAKEADRKALLQRKMDMLAEREAKKLIKEKERKEEEFNKKL